MTARFGWIALLTTVVCLLAGAIGTGGAVAAFGISEWDGHVAEGPDGVLAAGAHPEDVVTTIEFNSHVKQLDPNDPNYVSRLPDAGIRDMTVDLPPGFVGNPSAMPTCNSIAELTNSNKHFPICPINSIVGTISVRYAGDGQETATYNSPLFNMKPPPGAPAQFGFTVVDFPQLLTANVDSDRNYSVRIDLKDISQGLSVTGATTTFWGVPADSSHDIQRCDTYIYGQFDFCPGPEGNQLFGPNPASVGKKIPLLTNPTSCSEAGEGLRFDLFGESWEQPSNTDQASFINMLDPSTPLGTTGCNRVPFEPSITVQPTTDDAETPTGLEVALTVPPDGLNNPLGISQSNLKDAKVSLPEGMTINPGYADGVGYCSASQVGLLSGSSLAVRFNKAPAQCPDAAQLGEVRIDTPLIEEPLTGAVYVAQQNDPSLPGAENPFDSTLALYIVGEGSGIRVKLAGEVSPDQKTGQVITTFLNNPQVPFERFSLKFKGGQRAPLAMPAACGTYITKAELTPWARPLSPVTVTDSFQVSHGPDGGPCLANSPGARAFAPTLNAGTANNNAGSYSDFLLRMTRKDGEQEITSFSMDMPPGLTGKLAGVAKCSDAAIDAAKAKTGAQELASPSCPLNSQIGSVLVGSGVGSLLTYVPGKVYLAGPYKGSPLSVATITPAKTGPFDVGTVVVRSALRIDPETAQVSVDSQGSDPIPTIRDGITLHVRDIRVQLDRPEFTLNPTNCDRMAIVARLTGTGQDFVNPLDDAIASPSNPFQAANCAALPFKPKLSFKLKGGTKRGQFPAFQATLRARPGDANLAKTTVVLPRSEFIEQGHIRTVCTRVQFAAKQCPPGSIYGHARATTPLFDTPVEGPVYLRSNGGERLLPDLVVSLKNGEIEVALAGFIDSVKGRVRNAFNVIPDAPVTKFTLNMLGGKKGLLVNHLDLCEVTSRADVKMVGQNGKVVETRPKMGTSCGGKGRKGRNR